MYGVFSYCCHIPKIGNIGVMMRKNRARKLVELREPLRRPTERVPSLRRGFYAGAYGAVSYCVFIFHSASAMRGRPPF